VSARSARGYARFRNLSRSMLANLSCALIQNSADAERFLALGLTPEQLRITGNIKFDLMLNDELRAAATVLKQQASVNGQPVIWIAASTHQGEDEIILDAFTQLRRKYDRASLLLILVPRHPERFERVGQLCESRGYNIAYRSQKKITSTMDILLGDTMGELMLLFGASDIAFMGGSLVPNGGHNFIEPAAWGLPLLSGEHLFNFTEVSQLMLEADALQITANANELASTLELLIENHAMREQRGDNALRVAMENRGALDKTLKIINEFI
jgi:3-deoxy-D-manno-octulosonic-acid transferase